MKYRGLEIIEENGRVMVEGIKDFNLIHIFECGQCFRWVRQADDSFTGVVKNKVANVKFESGRLFISNSSYEDFQTLWFDYFDLGRDYSEIKLKLSKDKIMKEAIEFGYGIRILKQDIWETLISFIISANNRIPMIMRAVEVISKVYGSEMLLDGESYYSFPLLSGLCNSTVENLEVCRAGFRCKHIMNTTAMLKEKLIDLNSLKAMHVDEARCELTKLAGVGNKVADCTLLFSGTKYEVFPIDLWVKRVMEELYFKRDANMKEIQEFAKINYEEYAGIAQQYLFYYAREKRIGVKKTNQNK